MRKAIIKIIALLSTILVIQGCATMSAVSPDSKDGSASDRILQAINKLLDDKVGRVQGDRHDLLLLRAHLVVAMFARYGAARFGDYSSDPENDATKLLGRIWVAETAVVKALEAEQQGAPFYPVARTDLVLAVIKTVGVASKPTRRGLRMILIPASPLQQLKQGKTILKNALEDKLYVNAYKDGFETLLADVYQRPDKALTVNDWLVVNEFLLDACQRLRDIAKTEQQCIPKGVPGAS